MKNFIKYFLPLLFLPFLWEGLGMGLYAQQTTIDSLQNVLNSAKEDTNKVNTLNKLAGELTLILEYEKTFNCAIQASILSDKIDYKKGKAKSLTIIGVVYMNQGNYPEALKNYFASLKISEEIGNKKEIASSYNSIGNVFYFQGNYSEALKNYFSSLKIREAAGDKKGVAASYNNIGNIYYSQHNYPDALKSYFSSLKIREEMGDKSGVADSYNNIAIIYTEQGNYSEALKNYFASLDIREEIGDKKGVAYSYNNIGVIYLKQDNYSEALKSYLASHKIIQEIGDKAGIAASYCNLGSVHTKLGKFTEAKKYLDDGLSLSKEIGENEYIKMSYKSLSILDSTQGNFKSAYNNYKMFIVYRDSLVNEEKLKKTVQMQTRYEFEKEQIIKEQSALKLAQDEKERINRRNILQNTIILLFLIVVIGIVMSLGFVKVSERVAKGLIFVSLLLVFEFILVFMDPYLDNVTKGVPIYKLAANVLLATIIFPVHSILEKRFKKKIKKFQ